MTTSPFDADRPPEPPRDGRRRRRRAGRRGDPNATVPDAEFRSYYGRPIVKQAPWGHEIAYYLFLGGLAAGSGLVGAGAHLTGRPTLRRNARLGALASVGLGGVALIADLGRPERALNMMRTAKADPPRRLVQTWVAAWPSEETTLTWGLVEYVGPLTGLTLTHDCTGAQHTARDTEGTGNAEQGGGGWPWILAGLKTYLETGRQMVGSGS